MLRTDRGDPRVIDKFDGVNDLVDTLKLPDSYTAWMQGATISDKYTVERLGGKLAVSTATSPGSIYSITQLNFRDRSVVVVHTSTVFEYESDMSRISPVSNTSVNPNLPFIIP